MSAQIQKRRRAIVADSIVWLLPGIAISMLATPAYAHSLTTETSLPSVPMTFVPTKPRIVEEENVNLWRRLCVGLGQLPEVDVEQETYDRWHREHPTSTRRMLRRALRHLSDILDEIERRHLPTELALLPVIESGFDPEAVSPASATGLWQLMPATALDHGLVLEPGRDERLDPKASTRAALSLLDRLHTQFGNWSLALAAYNAGEARVQREIDRNAKLGLPTDYEHLRLPAETRAYVPRLLAVVRLVAHPTEFGIELPLAEDPFDPTAQPAQLDIPARVFPTSSGTGHALPEMHVSAALALRWREGLTVPSSLHLVKRRPTARIP